MYQRNVSYRVVILTTDSHLMQRWRIRGAISSPVILGMAWYLPIP